MQSVAVNKPAFILPYATDLHKASHIPRQGWLLFLVGTPTRTATASPDPTLHCIHIMAMTCYDQHMVSTHRSSQQL